VDDDNVVKPIYYGKIEVQNNGAGVWEPTVEWLNEFLNRSIELSQNLIQLGFSRRVRVLSEMGKIWREKLSLVEEKLAPNISKNTGYSVENVKMDLRLVEEVFNETNIVELFDKGLIGGWRSLDKPVEIIDGEFVWNRPLGVSLIISSGNTVIPAILPAVVSLASGNVTILRPSFSNYQAVVEIFKTLFDLVDSSVEGAREMASALLVAYFKHESKVFEHLLASAPLGIVNYWGGEPGRSVIASRVLKNPFHPKLIVNGPLTGLAIIDEESASEKVAYGLARDVVLYDQQLCSSPTYAIFIGSKDSALKFAQRLGEALNNVGRRFPRDLKEGELYNLILLRKNLEIQGVRVFYSENPGNAWTIAVKTLESVTNFAYSLKYPHTIPRRRFIEIIVLKDAKELKETILHLIEDLRRNGVDKFQTASIKVSERNLNHVLKVLSILGIYRVVPIGESFFRTPLEPYDGEFLPRYFTYTMYLRFIEKSDALKHPE
jgi:hypothetical protein